jgi:hypothetical protein
MNPEHSWIRFPLSLPLRQRWGLIYPTQAVHSDSNTKAVVLKLFMTRSKLPN